MSSNNYHIQRPASASATVASQQQQQQCQVSFSTRQLIDLKFDQLANKVFKELTNAHNSLRLFTAIDDILISEPAPIRTSHSGSALNDAHATGAHSPVPFSSSSPYSSFGCRSRQQRFDNQTSNGQQRQAFAATTYNNSNGDNNRKLTSVNSFGGSSGNLNSLNSSGTFNGTDSGSSTCTGHRAATLLQQSSASLQKALTGQIPSDQHDDLDYFDKDDGAEEEDEEEEDDDDDDEDDLCTTDENNSSLATPLRAQQVQSIQRHHSKSFSQQPHQPSQQASSDNQKYQQLSKSTSACQPSAGPLFKRHKNHSPGGAVSGTHGSPTSNKQQPAPKLRNQQQSFYSLAKSKTTATASATTNNNNNNPLSGQHDTNGYQRSKHTNGSSTAVDSSHGTNPVNSRFQHKSSLNPIVRSNTIASDASFDRGRLRQIHPPSQRHSQQKRSITTTAFNTKDIGSLYKPHMNYSTSVLGNHRLSDDDEIIIVPTNQSATSPSLTSLSPDMLDSTNDEEPQERFSISRTKSFWERLSNSRTNQCKPILSSY